MGQSTIPATRADFLQKYDANFDRKWCRSGFAEWRKQTWDGEEKSLVEIAEEALDVAASRCRVEELLDPIRALVDAKVIEALTAIRAGDAEQLRLDIERVSAGFVSRRDLEASSKEGEA